jgi:hypothetical protein
LLQVDHQAPGSTMLRWEYMTTFHGSCHCGWLSIEFSTARNPADFVPRACDCSFCRKHGAAYVSDPAGRLSISAREDSLRKYRQGSDTADFLLCGRCGVLAAVIFEHAGRLHGAVNIGCLDENHVFGTRVPASPQTLSAEAKVSRWLELWIPDVELNTADD